MLRTAGAIDWSASVVDGSHSALFKGAQTGPSRVDRGRTGSKHHLLVDAAGIPLAISLTGGNRNDVTQLLPLVDGSARSAVGPVGHACAPRDAAPSCTRRSCTSPAPSFASASRAPCEAGVTPSSSRSCSPADIREAIAFSSFSVLVCYREDIPESPRSQLLADPDTADWHTFAMEWKEHVAWVAPMLATAAFVVVASYGRDLIRNPPARRIGMTLFVAAFGVAVVAGLLGTLVTKKAPVT